MVCFNLKWDYDWENNSMVSSFGDRYCYWWEDMRPSEVMDLIKEVYNNGYNRGIEDGTGGD